MKLTDQERDGIYLYHEDTDKRFANQLGTNHRLSNDIGEQSWKLIKDFYYFCFI